MTLRNPLAIDLRTLALFRVSIAFCGLLDWCSAARYMTAFYTDDGLMPRSAMLRYWTPNITNTLHAVSGLYTVQLALFAAHLAALVALLLGWRTRLMTVVVLVLTVSLQNRNFIILQASDDLMRLLMFWAVFLPLGARYSVDAALSSAAQSSAHSNGGDALAQSHRSLAGVGILLQALCVYFFGALLKTYHDVWWPDLLAVYYALNADIVAMPLSHWLAGFVPLTKVLTVVVLALEILAPVFLLFPGWYLWVRLPAMAAIILMHIGFGGFLHIGIFWLVSITSILLFTPALVWDWLGEKLSTRRAGALRVYVDPERVAVHRLVLILREFLFLGGIPVRTVEDLADSDDAEFLGVADQEAALVVVDLDDRVTTGWSAVATLFRDSTLFYPLGQLLGSSALRRFGNRAAGWLEAPGRRRDRVVSRLLPLRPYRFAEPLLARAFMAFMVAYLLLWNFWWLPGMDGTRPDFLYRAGIVLRFEQHWDMFAPPPAEYDGWFVIAGRRLNGEWLDLKTNQPGEPSFDKPAYVPGDYPSQKWLKFFERLPGQDYAFLRSLYASYLCRQWNPGEIDEESLADIIIYYVVEPTPEPGSTRETTTTTLWEHRCI